MHNIIDTLLFMTTPHVVTEYLKLSIVFLSLACTGIVIFLSICKTRNKALLVGGGMISGPLLLTLLLSICSYLLKGTVGIAIISLLYILLTIILFRRLNIKLKISRPSSTTIVYALVITIYIFFFFFFAGNNIIGGDASTYWGLASSYTRGNYPTVLPWQPNYLSVYHSGTFLMHGAILALTGTRISLIHIFFSVYMLSAIFILLIGIAREKTRTILSFLPAVITVVVFSPLLLISGYSQFLSSLNITKPRQSIINMSQFPLFEDLKRQVGIGANSLQSFVYINFMLYGLACFILFVYLLLSYENRSILKKYLLLITVTLMSASIDETFFLIQVPLFCIFFFRDIRKFQNEHNDIKKTGKIILIVIITAITQFLLIQNPVRDSLLTPAQQVPRFILIGPSNQEFTKRIEFFNAQKSDPYSSTIWYTPDIRVVIAIILVLTIILRSRYGIVITSSAIICLIFSLFLLNTYWPENANRFTIRAYHLAAIAMGFLILEGINRKNALIKATSVLLLLSMVPALLVSHAKLINQATKPGHDKLRQTTGQYDQLLTQISKKIPNKSPILFIDEYPITDLGSALNGEAVIQYGFFVPTAPPNPKIVNYDAGIEWFDAVTTLDPESLKKLNVQYLFIKTNAVDRFSDKTKQLLNNPEYMEVLDKEDLGILYKVSGNFKNKTSEEKTIQKMLTVIPNESSVYLPRLQIAAIRNGIILNLSKHTKLSGPPLGKGDGYFLFIEDIPKYNELKTNEQKKDYEYIITDTQNKIDQYTDQKVELVTQNRFISVWKRVN